MEEDGILSIEAGLTKSQYHKLLAESSVMLTNSVEENFGFCLVESCLYGTMPLAPYGLSHTEVLGDDSRLLFDPEEDLVTKILGLMANPCHVKHYAEKYFGAIDRIAAEMRGQTL